MPQNGMNCCQLDNSLHQVGLTQVTTLVTWNMRLVWYVSNWNYTVPTLIFCHFWRYQNA